MTNHNEYSRPDGTVGIGFIIQVGGVEQHSIAWPDRPAERMKTDELGERGIKHWKATPAIVKEETPSEVLLVPELPKVFEFDPTKTESENIQRYLDVNPKAKNRDVIDALNKLGMQVSSSQVTAAKKAMTQTVSVTEETSDSNEESQASESYGPSVASNSSASESPTESPSESTPGSETTGV